MSPSKPTDGLSPLFTGSFQEGFLSDDHSFYRGRFEIKVDPKFRLILPAPFREVVKHTSDSRMVITNSQYQGKRCLDVYPFAEWKKLETRISKLPQLKVEVQNFQRFYLSGGHPVEADANFS